MIPFNFLSVISAGGLSNEFTNRQKIEIVEYWLKREFGDVAEELPVKHYLWDGHYARSLFIPAGILLTGKVHTHPGIFFLDYGDLSVMNDERMIRISGPASYKYQAGIKRAGYAHTDCLCTTFHRTTAKTVEHAEAELFEDSDLSWVEGAIAFPTVRVLE